MVILDALIPEILYPNIQELKSSYRKILNDDAFKKELSGLLITMLVDPHPCILPSDSVNITVQTFILNERFMSYWSAQDQ